MHGERVRYALALAGLMLVADAGASPARYRVELISHDKALAVSVCVRGSADAHRFEAPHQQAESFLLEAKRRSGGELRREDGVLVAPQWNDDCLDYRVDLGAVSRAGRRGLGWEFAGDVVAAPRTWLWRPAAHARDRDAEIEFVLPKGWSLTVPWHPLESQPPRRRFALGGRPPSWPSLVAFGRFDEIDLALGDDVIRYAALGDVAASQRDLLRRYAIGTARDVAAVFPRAFAQAPQLVLVPVGEQKDPIPFGQSYRGGANALVLYVDPNRRLSEYYDNWTLTHELVHLVHPYVGEGGRFMSEGLATYFQNVVRARAGRITARKGWEELDAGFGRGRSDDASLTLRETSRFMGERRLYMRAYWSGTALALRADLAWRTRTEDPTSLEDVLNAFVACCRARPRTWSAEDYLDELDRLAGGTPVFGPLFRAHIDGRAFPDLATAYATLGITANPDGTLAFDEAHRDLRRAIMGPESP
jgi:hypothetical protein